MNRKLGMAGAAVNTASVILFAFSMLIGWDTGSYLSSSFIAIGFVIMACSFCSFSPADRKSAAYAGMIFSVAYAVLALIVYFTQVTTLKNDVLSNQSLALLDFKRYGLFFNLDMLGYCMMSIATFFMGISLKASTLRDKWLKWLLTAHGIFAVSCFIIPIAGLFNTLEGGSDLIGTLVLEFWCVYFIPVGVLSFLHFKEKLAD